jgi:Zn-dependent peptidase ImmA (M78 family)
VPGRREEWERRLQAAESAGRLLDELGMDPTRQIDVFGMCEDLGLWLAFLPMDKLLGAFVPEGVGGVLITDRRPSSVQRYTAAHELGHWRLDLGRGVALDGEEHVFGASPVERERLAQTFAASLLMPPPLLLSLIERMGLSSGETMEPVHAYFVAREAGVSYEAAVRQLGNIGAISSGRVTALLEVNRLSIKRSLANGRRPINGYADVWPVDEHWDDQLVSMRVEDEVVISLPENRSTGYRWMFDHEVDHVESQPEPPAYVSSPKVELSQTLEALRAVHSAVGATPPADVLRRLGKIQADNPHHMVAVPQHRGVDLVGDEYLPGRLPAARGNKARRIRIAAASAGALSAESPSLFAGTDGIEPAPAITNGPEIGSTGRRLIGLRFGLPGPQTLRLQHRSPYNNDAPTEEYVLHALVEPRRKGMSVDQLVSDPDDQWVSAVRDRRANEPPATITDFDESIQH